MIQGKVFLLMGAVGIVIGFVFSVFRAFRIAFKNTGNKFDFISAQITDVLFAVVAFCLFTVGIFVFGEGEVRSYCFLGTLAGVFLYFLLPGRLIGRILHLFFKILYKLFVEIPKKVFTKRK